MKFMDKFKNKIFFRTVTIITAIVIFAVTVLSIMLPSYLSWNAYYQEVKAEQEEQKRINALPLTLENITAELADGVEYYLGGFSELPTYDDLIVKATFSEKGKTSQKTLKEGDYTLSYPTDFNENGGDITVTYVWTPEKKNETDPAPVSVEKSATIPVILREPAPTIYKMVETPTYTQVGKATNYQGNEVTLPALNNTDYEYFKNGAQGIFDHAETNLRIIKPITTELTVKNGNTTSYINNVDANFIASPITNVTLSGDDEGVIFTVAEGKEVSIDTVEYPAGGLLTFAGAGTFRITKHISNNYKGCFVLKAGATLDIQLNESGGLITHDALLEVGSITKVYRMSDNRDCFFFNGLFEMYGKMDVTTSTENRNSTLFGMKNNVDAETAHGTLKFDANTRITVVNTLMTICAWNQIIVDGVVETVAPKGKIQIPKGAVKSGTNYTMGSGESLVYLMQATNCATSSNNCDVENYDPDVIPEPEPEPEVGYSVVTEPTYTTTGTATNGKNNVTLEKLNLTDYTYAESGTTATFTHKVYTDIVITKTITQANLFSVGGVKYSDVKANALAEGLSVTYESGTVTMTIAEGKTATINDKLVVTDDLVIAGTGKLIVNGQLRVRNLTCNTGTDVTINVNSDDALWLTGENNTDGAAGGIVKLYGTMLVNANVASGVLYATAISGKSANVQVELASTSRVTLKNFQYGFAAWPNNNLVVYRPTGSLNGASAITLGEDNLVLCDNTTNLTWYKVTVEEGVIPTL